MEIKGTALVSTLHFLNEKFPDKYDEWLQSLPEGTKKFFDDGIMAGTWYPIVEAYIVPTEIIGKICFDGDVEKAAYELGKYSGLDALKGIYKIFVKIASMAFVLKRLKSIFATYYSNGTVETIDKGNVKYFKVIGFQKGHEIIITRIAGWAEALFTVIAKKPTSITHVVKEIEEDFIEGHVEVKWDNL
ncbi:MAG: hypothetical protein JXL97_14405 [Bacteroidales bacterium]|nr:hypothetical protein [Bacteroidales bacterium]